MTGEVIDSDSRDVTVRLRDGNAVFKDSCLEDWVTLKIDLVVDRSGDDNSEIDFAKRVDTTVNVDVLGSSVVAINSVWKLEISLLIRLDVTSEVTLGPARDVTVIITLDLTVDTVPVFVLVDLMTDEESSFDDRTVETAGDDDVTLTDEYETRIGVTIGLTEVL